MPLMAALPVSVRFSMSDSSVRVAELYPAKRRVRFDCLCEVNGKPVLEGEAVLMVPARAVAA